MESLAPIFVFNFLAAGGFAMLLATLLPALLSADIHRSKTWFSMITSWIIYALSYLLIIGHQSDSEPPRGLCVLQMIFIYASPPLTAISGLAFIVDTHLSINKALFSSRVGHIYTRPLLLVPWAIFGAVAVEALVAVQDFTSVRRNPANMYCHSTSSVQYLTTSITCVIGLSVALCLTIWTAIILHRNWALFRRLSMHTRNSELRLSSLIRILLFTMMTTIGLGLGTFGVTSNDGEGVQIWSALLPLLPFLCGFAFGTQKDILSCWMFWKWRTSSDAGSSQNKAVGTFEDQGAV
ncbi:hypothetical protein C8R46DRAFT_1109940 [Mycena filopes]|nr:hypothetical protein C8R46DRAFT_1109940 [Mycena filopes]